MALTPQQHAFPQLTDSEMDEIRSISVCSTMEDGEVVFTAGDANIDFYVVESGALEITNPADDDRLVTVHGPREFAGDIDLLTKRPVIVSARARGKTVLLRAPANQFRELLNRVPPLGEKLIVAFGVRRQLLQESKVLGVTVIGQPHCPNTTLIREFLHRNFLPSTWYDSDSDEGKQELQRLGRSDGECPVVESSDGSVLVQPSIIEVSKTVGIQMPHSELVFDLAIVGSGPAGMTAAVYAASEGLSTIVLDRLGPGGQAAGTSKIENFIGFPSGLSGTELATRGVLQMLKFGATLLSPVRVHKVDRKDDLFLLSTDAAGEIRCRCVLAATGAKWRTLDAKNAERFQRRGVYYAATSVEARLCTGGRVGIVGGGNSGGQAAMFLSECAEHVYFFIRGDDLGKGMSSYLATRIKQNSKIQLMLNTEVSCVYGDEKLTSVQVKNTETGAEDRLNCDALFVFIGAEPYSEWLPDDVARDDRGYLLTGREAEESGKWPLKRPPCSLETTVPGILAAGDIRAEATKRVAFAVGDGAMAVTCVHRLRAMQ